MRALDASNMMKSQVKDLVCTSNSKSRWNRACSDGSYVEDMKLGMLN
ncbi:17183_t:CDS:1, partial [Gigaspora margarita]